jgi:hypothetical protein
MQRIVKNTPVGNAIIDNVLYSAWSTDENRYEGDIYYGLIGSDNRALLVNSFLAEQHSKCCYCMKDIVAHEVTIEHIIPQKATLVDFNSYLTVDEFSTLLHKEIFDRNNWIIPPARYPHDLGYNNLIASCNSSSHCNNKRGKVYIDPFMYSDVMITTIYYEQNGSMFTESVNVEALHLNNDFLKMIRKLWFLISKKLENLAGINDAVQLQSMVDEVIYNENERFIETFSGEASKVSELFKYKWFFNYYKEIRD